MTFAGEKPDITTLPEYQLATSTRLLIEDTAAGMTWTQQWEWLRVGILREAGRLTQTLDEGYKSELIAEWILGIGSCRNAVVMSDYIFTFLKGQNMMPAEKADPILESLKQLMAAILALSNDLRRELASQRAAS